MRVGIVVAALVAGAALSGCITGERPTLASEPAATGDAAVDAVLVRLDAAATSAFTADYSVLTRFGDLTTPARVVQDGTARRSITIGSIRFLTEGASTATCDLATGQCSETIDANRVSDTQLAPDFYSLSAAARLRRDAELRSGPTAASTEAIAGQQATCVSVPTGTSTSTYCVLDSGALARLDAADVAITLTAYAPSVDEAAFARSG